MEELTLPEPLERLLAQSWPPRDWQDLHVLVAVSGGADSVALLRGMLAIKDLAGGRGRVFVGHFNHKVRGKDSDADSDWVEALARQFGVEVIAGCPNLEFAAEKVSEEQARQARYDFLIETAHQIGARSIVTGHNSDDQAETVLHRVLRGASIQGLCGIPFSRSLSPTVDVVRPLLGVKRDEITAYLSRLGQSYRTDASNLQAIYSRNVLRLEVLPLLRERFGPHVDEALRRLGTHASEAQGVIQSLAKDLESAAIEANAEEDCIVIEPSCLTGAPRLVVCEACKLAWRGVGWPEQAMGSTEWHRLYRFLVGDCGEKALNLPGDVDARRVAGRIVLQRHT